MEPLPPLLASCFRCTWKTFFLFVLISLATSPSNYVFGCLITTTHLCCHIFVGFFSSFAYNYDFLKNSFFALFGFLTLLLSHSGILFHSPFPSLWCTFQLGFPMWYLPWDQGGRVRFGGVGCSCPRTLHDRERPQTQEAIPSIQESLERAPKASVTESL